MCIRNIIWWCVCLDYPLLKTLYFFPTDPMALLPIGNDLRCLYLLRVQRGPQISTRGIFGEFLMFTRFNPVILPLSGLGSCYPPNGFLCSTTFQVFHPFTWTLLLLSADPGSGRRHFAFYAKLGHSRYFCYNLLPRHILMRCLKAKLLGLMGRRFCKKSSV